MKLASLVTTFVVAGNAQLFQPRNDAVGYSKGDSFPINITELFNNRGFGMESGDANFDTYHSVKSLPFPSIVYC